ncbi:polyprenyl synthetase family protein [Kyrpidia spormannii]|uniref:polyprenyl synthetase family protein n=1 Tax=Kyrpidia spormannii TaxID=2055160 RepID=UPI001E2E103A|nr:farnesyl diphosphate synthase [Kyrpidia spormannii]
MSDRPVEQELREFWEAGARAVNDALDALIPPGKGAGRLHEAMRYSLFAGGKRLRPLLAMAACEGAGGSLREALPAACALELVHTYSLIHDDLPAMDDDDYRRGRPTNHRVFGEAMAVLAGDALLTLAFGVLAKAPLPPTTRIRLVEELAEASGKEGMVGGQALDIEATGAEGPPDPELLRDLHRKKTGALIIASLRMGGLCAGADESLLDRLSAYGQAVGLAYQIVDDLLDVGGDARRIGKAVGRDAALNKLTWPGVYGVDRSREDVRRLTKEAIAHLHGFPGDTRHLVDLARYLADRDW